MQAIILILDALLVAYLIESTWIKTRQDNWIQTLVFTIILGISVQSIIVMIIWLLKMPIIFSNIFIINILLIVSIFILITLKRDKRQKKSR
jgi:hypothetical protein